MKKHNFVYIAFASYGHIDWGGTVETLQELQERGHNVAILSGDYVKEFVESKRIPFVDIGLGGFRPRKADESIEAVMGEHQFMNFFNTESIINSYERGLDYIQMNDISVILSDPLCKTSPLISMKTGIPYGILGFFDEKSSPPPPEKPGEDILAAIGQFMGEFEAETQKLGIVDGHKIPLILNSPWLNVVYSTPGFDGPLAEKSVQHVGADPLPLAQGGSDRLKVFYSSGSIFWDQKQIEAVVGLADQYPIDLHITRGKIMPDLLA